MNEIIKMSKMSKISKIIVKMDNCTELNTNEQNEKKE